MHTDLILIHHSPEGNLLFPSQDVCANDLSLNVRTKRASGALRLRDFYIEFHAEYFKGRGVQIIRIYTRRSHLKILGARGMKMKQVPY